MVAKLKNCYGSHAAPVVFAGVEVEHNLGHVIAGSISSVPKFDSRYFATKRVVFDLHRMQ